MGEQVALLILSFTYWIRHQSPVIKDVILFSIIFIIMMALAIMARKWLHNDDPQDFDDNLSGGIV